PERVLKGHRDRENSLDYGQDGRLVTGGNDKTARVWPAHDGRQIVLSGHTRGVMDAAFWVDPSRVLSVSLDHTLRLWDSRTGSSLGVLETSPRPLWGMAVSPDGAIATIDDRSELRVLKCDVCGSLQD